VLCLVLAVGASAQVNWLFTEDWESGYPNGWTSSGNTAFALSTVQALSPVNSLYAAVSATATTRAWKNTPVINHPTGVVAEWWIYDTTCGSGGRQYNEIRAYAGKAYNSGALSQLYAAGIYNTVTAAGDTYDGTKYQARVAFGTGGAWFNLNAAGAPSRSRGWHKFTFSINPTANTADIYVDGILGRTWAANWVGWVDSAIVGSGVTSNGRDAYFDDIRIGTVPEPGSMLAMATGLVGLAGFGIRRRRA